MIPFDTSPASFAAPANARHPADNRINHVQFRAEEKPPTEENFSSRLTEEDRRKKRRILIRQEMTSSYSPLTGVGTGLVVGYAVKSPLKHTRGWRWFMLPFLSIAIGSVVFGVSGSVITWVSAQVHQDQSEIHSGWWLTGAVYFFYALTLYTPVTYPASLLTHFVLRRYALRK